MAVRISSRVSSVKHNTSTAKKNNKVSSSTKAKSSSKGITTKAKTTSKTKVNMSTKSNKVSSLGTKTGSSIKQTTTYLRDAPKLYTSSGIAYSYGRPAQSYVAQNKATSNKRSGSTTNATAIKTSSIKTKSGTTNNTANKKNVVKATSIVSTSKKNSKAKGNTSQTTAKSITYGRPAESYIAENQTKSLPKATQVPIQKKSAKSNSDKVKIYEPTDSRSGAGKYSYAKKTSPTGAKEGASFIVSSLPIVGDAKDVQEAITGKDLVTGKKLSNTDRVITAAASVIPVVSGKSVNTIRKTAKSPTVKKAVKSGTKKLKQSTEEIIKKAKSGINKISGDVVDNVKKKVPSKGKEDVKIDSGNNGEKVKKGGSGTTKPHQLHHYATNKNKTYTPQFEKIASKYGLALDNTWNKELFLHQGRHPNAYHEYVLDSMKQFDEIAQGNKDLFLKLYDKLKKNVKDNPDMLYKDYWNK